jgi:molybdenum cofactor cytidylyltransferase
MRIVGILLAAGKGTRFGGEKLLARLEDGTAIGARSARNLKAALAEVIAVVRPEDRVLQELLAQEGCRVEPCATAWQGMGASLAHGVGATRDADGWIVALADMPLIAPATIRAVAAALAAGAPLAAPYYRGDRGHPVGFAAVYAKRLAALEGDAGARDILREEGGRIERIDCDDPGVLADVDTQEQFARLQQPEEKRK